MLKSIEDINPTKKRLNIEIPADAVEGGIKQELDYIRLNAKIPGFRPGKAPIDLIIKRFGSSAEAQAIEKIIPEYYSSAVKEAGITPLGSPELAGKFDFKRNIPINVSFDVEFMPKLEGVKYKGINIKKITIEVMDADIDLTLQRLRQDKAVYNHSDSPIADGDLVTVDYDIKEMGKTVNDDVVRVGSPAVPHEFTENLSGKNIADVVEFQSSFSDKHMSQELAGKTLTFKVAVKDVKKPELPEIDDEFAKDLGYEGLQALRENIKDRLLKSRDETIKKAMKADVLMRILESTSFYAPESMVKDEITHLITEARASGRQEPEELLQSEFEPIAQKRVKSSVLLMDIGEREAVKVGDEEIKAKIVELSQRLNLTPDNVIKYYMTRDGSLSGLSHSIFEEKVLDILLNNAVFDEGGQP